MAFDKLKGLMVEKGYKYIEAAIYLGVSETTFCSKMNGKKPWKREEMEQLCKMLHIPLDQMHKFFYSE